jgi:HEAT repeat protein
LGNIGPPAAAAVPALSNLVATGDTYQRLNAATAICKIKWSERAWASLTNLLSDPQKDIRLGAARNIWAVSSNENLTLPVLIHELALADTFGKSQIVYQLNVMGPRAKAAVPALLNELTSTDSDLRLAITNALQKIDPALPLR